MEMNVFETAQAMTFEQMQAQGKEPWGILIDFRSRHPQFGAWFRCENVTREVAEQALSWWNNKINDGIEFTDRATSQRDWLSWDVMSNLRIMPMREML